MGNNRSLLMQAKGRVNELTRRIASIESMEEQRKITEQSLTERLAYREALESDRLAFSEIVKVCKAYLNAKKLADAENINNSLRLAARTILPGHNLVLGFEISGQINMEATLCDYSTGVPRPIAIREGTGMKEGAAINLLLTILKSSRFQDTLFLDEISSSLDDNALLNLSEALTELSVGVQLILVEHSGELFERCPHREIKVIRDRYNNVSTLEIYDREL